MVSHNPSPAPVCILVAAIILAMETEGSSRRHPGGPRRMRRTRRREVDGRRLGTAGGAVVVSGLALVIGTLLNAPGIHKKAYNEPAGWKRDVALAITGPLATVSEGLYLDAPRSGIQSAIGRTGIDDIDTDLDIVVAPPKSGPPGRTTAPRRTTFTPRRPLRLTIVGDSLVLVPGFAILRAAATNRAIKPVGRVDGRVSTGLARPDVYNWFTAVRELMASKKPRAVVLSFGGNDTNSYMTAVPDGVSIGSFGSAAWVEEYRRRVGALFDIVNRGGAHAVWIGLPQTSDTSLTQKFEVLNAAVHAEAIERPRSVSYIDTYISLAGSDGRYAEYVSLPGEGDVKIRADDGVHFEPAGGDIIAREVLEALGEAYDISSWKS